MTSVGPALFLAGVVLVILGCWITLAAEKGPDRFRFAGAGFCLAGLIETVLGACVTLGEALSRAN